MNERQRTFADEYVKTGNATQSAIKAGYSAKTAQEQGSRLLTNVMVKEYVEERQAELAEERNIDQQWVLDKLVGIVEADPNDLMQLRRYACRHCHGEAHEHQWRNEAEFARAVHAHKKGRPPMDVGGYGYSKKLDPHPDCPECDGEGVLDVFSLDTRKLSPGAKMLFAGLKVTQHGIEIKTHDQMKALESIARNLGFFKDVVKVEVSDDAIEALKAARKSAR